MRRVRFNDDTNPDDSDDIAREVFDDLRDADARQKFLLELAKIEGTDHLVKELTFRHHLLELKSKFKTQKKKKYRRVLVSDSE